MKEIKIQELENIKIGSAENKDAATGCTVILCEPVSYTHLNMEMKT